METLDEVITTNNIKQVFKEATTEKEVYSMNVILPGQNITLAKDWTFNLDANYTNSSLSSHFGYECTDYNYGWVKKEDYLAKPIANYRLPFISSAEFYGEGIPSDMAYKNYRMAMEESKLNCEPYQNYQKSLKTYTERMTENSLKAISVTLPKGTDLTLECFSMGKRIRNIAYFTTKSLGSTTIRQKYAMDKFTKKYNSRFYVDLKECNNIKYQIN